MYATMQEGEEGPHVPEAVAPAVGASLREPGMGSGEVALRRNQAADVARDASCGGK